MRLYRIDESQRNPTLRRSLPELLCLAEDNERHIETTPEERARIVEIASKTPYMWELMVFAIFCTMVADTGVGLYDLMAVSGHKDPKMAMRYINRSLANKAKTVAGLK